MGLPTLLCSLACTAVHGSHEPLLDTLHGAKYFCLYICMRTCRCSSLLGRGGLCCVGTGAVWIGLLVPLIRQLCSQVKVITSCMIYGNAVYSGASHAFSVVESWFISDAQLGDVAKDSASSLVCMGLPTVQCSLACTAVHVSPEPLLGTQHGAKYVCLYTCIRSCRCSSLLGDRKSVV